ncbi:putative aquaporin NIP5-1 [Ananas comosus]|uniref:Putative aquaporin NIP5-1 n=1 Tax=Ananas comosus TaxID=4615 RepID=A0A199VER2_ANACO|nr:putative aquaporin NIP5-1 [Ananas comosus]
MSEMENGTSNGEGTPRFSYDWNLTPICSRCFPALIKKLGAEFVGTFILILAGTAAPIVNQKYSSSESLIGNATAAGLAVVAVVLSIGHISGAHLNPSLTIAFAVLRRLPWGHVLPYIATQAVASITAAFVVKEIFDSSLYAAVTIPTVSIQRAFTVEFIITFNLVFVVTAVTTDTRGVKELAAIAVGATIMFNALIAGPLSGASMNPVRTLGPALVAGIYTQMWIYFLAPTLGAVTGALAYKLVQVNHEDAVAPRSGQSF